MSLPVRPPQSHYQLSSSQPSPKSTTDQTVPTTRNQATNHTSTSTKIANMSQPATDSSPLSSVPSSSPQSVTPPSSFPPRSPGTPYKIHDPVLEKNETASPTPTADLNMSKPKIAKKRTPQLTSKRSRDDDDEEGSLPSKKTTNPSNAKAKAKPAPKKTPTKPAPKKPAAKKPAAKKPATKKAAPPPPPSNRPSRNRKAPERFEDITDTTLPKAPPTKKGGSKVFDPTFITTNSTSRLGKADVYHMLLEQSAWSNLSKEQQVTLMSMLPQSCANTGLVAKIKNGETEGTRPQAFTMSNDCFRTDVAKFKLDLKNGHLGKTWQAAAEQAVIERAAGEYDTWKAEEAESWWGQKSEAA